MLRMVCMDQDLKRSKVLKCNIERLRNIIRLEYLINKLLSWVIANIEIIACQNK